MRILETKWNSIQAAACCLLFLCIWVFLPPQTVHGASSAVSARLPVEQIFISDSSTEEVSAEFAYELTPIESGNPMPAGSVFGVYSFTITGDSTLEIGPMVFNSPGVYSYTLQRSPSATSSPGYIYDQEVYRISFYVSMQGGELTQKLLVYRSDHTKTGNIRFENSYHFLPSNPGLIVDPPVKKTVSGSPANQSTFLFTLTAGNTANPMPAGSINGVKTISIVGSGEKDFGTWAYTKKGIYYYTIAEIDTGEKNYTYDTAIYTITDAVVEVDGQLTVNRTVTNRSNKPVESCIYINKYKGTSGGGTISGGSDNRDRDRNPNKPGTVIGDDPVPSSGSNTVGIADLPTPMTGDDTLTTPYVVAIVMGILVAAGCSIWLLFLRNRGEDQYAESN